MTEEIPPQTLPDMFTRTDELLVMLLQKQDITNKHLAYLTEVWRGGINNLNQTIQTITKNITESITYQYTFQYSGGLAGTSDVKPVEVQPGSRGTTVDLTTDDSDIIIHSLYVSHDNAVAIKLTLQPAISIAGRYLTFTGIFGNSVQPVSFNPPLGPYKKGKIKLTAEGPGASDPVYVNLQYSTLQVSKR